MEKVFYTCGDANLKEINQVLAAGGKVKTVTVSGGRDYKSAEAYIVVELPPQNN